MSSIVFVNLSHPGEIRNRNVQTNIRRHVMRDIGRSRRKKPRPVIIPLEVRRAKEKLGSKGTESELNIYGSSNQTYNYGLCRSPKGSGILGIELDEDELHLVQYSKKLPVDILASCWTGLWNR